MQQSQLGKKYKGMIAKLSLRFRLDMLRLTDTIIHTNTVISATLQLFTSSLSNGPLVAPHFPLFFICKLTPLNTLSALNLYVYI